MDSGSLGFSASCLSSWRKRAEIVNPMRSNRFELDERTVALYGSYQMRLTERWGALAGLRAEYTDLNVRQITSGVEASNNYVNYIPSLFATYKVSDESNLRFSYAHRIRRPNAGDLNPYVVYRDEFNVSAGNPKLKPTQTDSFEIGYETKIAGLESSLRAYHRRDTDAIVDPIFLGANGRMTALGVTDLAICTHGYNYSCLWTLHHWHS